MWFAIVVAAVSGFVAGAFYGARHENRRMMRMFNLIDPLAAELARTPSEAEPVVGQRQADQN